MRGFPIFLWTLGAALASPVGSIAPGAPLRFVAPQDGLMHVSLHRGYDQLPGSLEIVEVGASGWAGEVRSYMPENTQTHPGVIAFRTGRVLKGHTYEARASQAGNLDVQFFAASPDPQQAVETGMSWLIRSADAWLSNQPRQGAIAKEGQLQHPEARACIACHITQFSTRAYLTAAMNGYPEQDSTALASVMHRLRENPRPLYGHAGVNWARVIYSARTVSSRLPMLWSAHRVASSEDPMLDRELILGAARFLLLSDECGAGQLRAEADGSRPDVSGFEIGLQTVQTFRLAATAEPTNPQWARQAACVEGMLTKQQPANVIDAAWRIIALERAGRPTSAAIAELLRYQQADGRFALEFSKTAPAADFISYHVLYALAVARYRGPEVDRLAAYTLRAQRADGSWKGAPDYKGFDTPFRETQFAVMALSELNRRVCEGCQLSKATRPLSEGDPWRSPDRDAVQRRLLARMANDDEAAQPLVEALAATLDDNLGQLREWQRSMRRPEDQARVEQALRADSQREATLLAASLRSGSRTLRWRVLTAMATMVGVDNSARRPRVGNDLEGPQILADADGVLEQEILKCIDPRDEALTTAAIRAGAALSDVLTPSFTKAMLRLMPRFGEVVAEAYGEGGRGRLTLSRDNPNDPELLAVVEQILKARDPQGLTLVLPLLSALEPGHRFTREPGLTGEMESLLRDRKDGPVLQAAGVFANVVDGPLMRTQVMSALAATDPAVARVAVDVVLERYLVNPRVTELTVQYLAASSGLARRMLLDSLDPNRLRFDMNQVSAYSPPRIPIPLDGNILAAPFLQEFVLESLRMRDPQVQAAALDLTRKQATLRRSAAIETAMAALANSSTPRTQLISRAATAKQEPQLAPESMLDFEYFRQRIHPLLQKPGPDGRSCTMCHASNARFPLRGDVAANYRSAAGKVSLLDPAASPLLVKPLLPGNAADGDVFRTSHNGGERWPGRTGSAEYQLILEWIRGGRVTGSTN